jgi:putative membrane protein
MQEFHPDVRERSYMNQMMGGEGSANLKAMYRMMGYRYLLTDGQMGPGFGYGPMMGRGGYGPGYGRMMGGGYGPGFGRRYGYGPGRRGPGMMGDRWDHMDDWHYRGYFGGWWMWLIAIVLIGAVIYFAVKSYQKKGTGGSSNSLEILKERYAKGEITKEEYDSMKKDLKE